MGAWNESSLTEVSRFGSSSLHQRDPRSALFEGYEAGGSDRPRHGSNISSRGENTSGYGYNGNGGIGGLGPERAAYRPATPNSRYGYLRCSVRFDFIGSRRHLQKFQQ